MNKESSLVTSDTDQLPHTKTFEVIYYKRSNRVHKGKKGVSKFDGKLFITAAPTSRIQLFDDTNNCICNIMSNETAKKVFHSNESCLEEIQLPQWECEIVSEINNNSYNSHTKKIVQNNTKNLNKFNPLNNTVRKGFTSVSRATILKTVPTAMSHKSMKPPVTTMVRQTVNLTKNTSTNESSTSSSDDKNSISNDENHSLSASNNILKRVNNPLSSASKAPLGRKRKLIVNRNFVSISKSKKYAQSNNDDSVFPGAIGVINVPPSIKNALRLHQREGIAFLWNCFTGNVQSRILEGCCEEEDDGKKYTCSGVLLADEMGLGKTLMTISTIFALHRRQRDQRFIVVCPSSLVGNWAKEFDKWLGKASKPKRVIIKKGGSTAEQSIKAFTPLKPNQSEVLVISYDLFRMHSAKLSEASKIGLLVVDEGHRLKNANGSATLDALNSIETTSKLLISGTPIQNNLSEFYSLAEFVNPGCLGSLSSFRRLYERPITEANQKGSSSSIKAYSREQAEKLNAVTSKFMLRRLQKDVLKTILPPRFEFLLFCKPSDIQKKLYLQISDSYTSSVDGSAALNVLTKLRKLCGHPLLLEEEKSVNNNSDTHLDKALSGKTEIIDALLDNIHSSTNDKCVVVSSYTSTLTLLEKLLRAREFPFVRLDGSTDQSQRQVIVDSFNRSSREKSFVFLLSSKAGGCGLNLVAANRLVMFDGDWNPSNDAQAMARIYRQGQTKECFIYRLFLSGTIDEIMLQRQTHKLGLADAMEKQQASSSTKFTEEELRECFTLKETPSDTKDKLVSTWNKYNGAASLYDLGVNDSALLKCCDSNIIQYVRVAQNDEDDESGTEITTNKKQNQLRKELFINTNNNDEQFQKNEDDSSEYEFEY